jgi:hypothetical protein
MRVVCRRQELPARPSSTVGGAAPPPRSSIKERFDYQILSLKVGAMFWRIRDLRHLPAFVVTGGWKLEALCSTATPPHSVCTIVCRYDVKTW